MKTDNINLGHLIEDENAGRDAIHIAVAPCVAQYEMWPGSTVTADGIPVPLGHNKAVGIVDPFLREKVANGQKFWICLYPYTVTSLRHTWTHPAFPASAASTDDSKAKSMRWLREFAREHDDFSVDDLIDAATNRNVDGDYLSFGDDIYGEIPDEFYDHVEVVSGKIITNRPKYFSCAC